MKTLLTLIAAAVLAATSLTSCTTDGTASPDTGALVSVSVTYATAKAVQSRPSLAPDLAGVATALETLAEGVINKETVLALLDNRLPLGSPEAKALAALIVSYFPSGDAAIPVNEKLSVLARNIAAAIRLGLPASK